MLTNNNDNHWKTIFLLRKNKVFSYRLSKDNITKCFNISNVANLPSILLVIIQTKDNSDFLVVMIFDICEETSVLNRCLELSHFLENLKTSCLDYVKNSKYNNVKI